MFGDKIIPLSIGQEVNVFFEVESKEFNGRWFTNLRAWKVDVIGGSSVSLRNSQQQQLHQARHHQAEEEQGSLLGN